MDLHVIDHTGGRVAKNIGRTIHLGMIMRCGTDAPFWFVEHNDGDHEDMDLHEVEQALQTFDGQQDSDAPN